MLKQPRQRSVSNMGNWIPHGIVRKTGNLSSASVLVVLEEVMKRRRPSLARWACWRRWAQDSAPNWSCCDGKFTTSAGH